MSNLKARTISAFGWSMFEGVSGQGVTFVVGILLARILSPEDFGLIGIITVFISVSDSIVEAGLGNALIRNNDATDDDYSTVFYSNLGIAMILYLTLFFSSHSISLFFNQIQLESMLKVFSVVTIINSLSLVQRTVLIKKLNFKLQSFISLSAALISGTIALILAYNGYGVWSLVILTLVRQSINLILLWFFNRWLPSLVFSISSFKENFNYGYKLLLANLINTIYKNIYNVIIGKYFSAASLGYYNRADSFQQPFSMNIGLGIRRISFPVLSLVQGDKVDLKNKFRKFIKYSFFLSSVILTSLAASAKPLVLILIGEKWIPSIYYLQLLCIPGILYPLQILNLNILNIKGYSGLNLRLEVVKKIVLIPLIYLCIQYGIEVLLYGFVLFSIVEYFINSFYTKMMINYSVKEQFNDIVPFLGIALVGFCLLFSITLLKMNIYNILFMQVAVGVFFYTIVVSFFNLSEIKEIRAHIKQIIQKFKK